MTGPALWIRISKRFGPRLSEWMLAAITTAWGVVLLAPFDTFAVSDAWRFFASFIEEWQLGSMMLTLGTARLVALIVNGTRPRVTPQIRRWSAVGGLFLWGGITYSFAASGAFGVWAATYPIFVVVEGFNIYRASHDVGESHGSA